MGSWMPVQTPVDAKVGPIVVRLAHYVWPSSDPDDCGKPWAVLGMCRVTFRFGGDLVSQPCVGGSQ